MIKRIAILILAIFLSGIMFSGAASADSLSPDAAKDKLRRGNLLLKKIESSLANEEKTNRDVRENIKEVKLRMRKAQEKVQTLKGQLQNIQSLSRISKKKILAIQKQIAEKKTELTILQEIIDQKREEKRLAEEKYAKNTRAAKDRFDSESGFGSLSVLLAFQSVSDYFQEKFYRGLGEQKNQELIKEIDRAARELNLTQKRMLEKYEVTRELKQKHESELRNLMAHQEAKRYLLTETKGQEEIYKALLEEAKQEQQEIEKNLEHLKANFEFVEQKLQKLREDELLQTIFSIEDFEEAVRSMPFVTNAPLKWPVSPIRGISAYFRDESYRRAMGISHNAVDIRIPQETKVKAATAGVILQVRDEDGAGYNYVLIAHRNGLLTLYGHLTEIYVKEGDTVFSGETIGLSGGIPGTRGAGWLTTGAHLHLEVFKDWKHVDPLDYLPLEFLPIEYVPKKYLPKLFGDDKKKIRREEPKKVKRILESDIM